MGVEEPIEMALVGVCEMIGPPHYEAARRRDSLMDLAYP